MSEQLPRHLIVNADDFGQCSAINRGIIEAHELGIVTSASLMVRWPAAGEAAEYSRSPSRIDLGLHVDLGEWRFHDGGWQPRYEVVPLTDAVAVEAEVFAQLDKFYQLCGRTPTHLDSHQHVHCREPVRSIVKRVAADLQVPVRHFDRTVQYCGRFYGQDATGLPNHRAITVETLLEIIRELPAGYTELCCHPGHIEDFESTYRDERLVELRVLCARRVRREIVANRVQLCSFGRLAGTVRE